MSKLTEENNVLIEQIKSGDYIRESQDIINSLKNEIEALKTKCQHVSKLEIEKKEVQKMFEYSSNEIKILTAD